MMMMWMRSTVRNARVCVMTMKTNDIYICIQMVSAVTALCRHQRQEVVICNVDIYIYIYILHCTLYNSVVLLVYFAVSHHLFPPLLLHPVSSFSPFFRCLRTSDFGTPS